MMPMKVEKDGHTSERESLQRVQIHARLQSSGMSRNTFYTWIGWT